MSRICDEVKAADKFTVLGAAGFIGSHLVERLRALDAEVLAPTRDQTLTGDNLGNVIYCIGLTADFRTYPLAAIEAHICRLRQFLQDCEFHSLLYLSSVRLYGHRAGLAREEDPVTLSSASFDDLYGISKLMGESMTLFRGKNGRVGRLSNVYGQDFQSQNFLGSIITEAITKPEVTIRSSPETEKDYVSIDDAVDALIQIALRGQQVVYNIASGVNVSNQALAHGIGQLTGCRMTFDPRAAGASFPMISIDRLRSEFPFQPRHLLEDLSELIDGYKQHVAATSAA